MGLFLAGLVTKEFRPWLKPYEQPQRGGPGLHFRAGDLTPLFSVWTQITARSLYQDGEFPLWSDHIYCGEPFFAKPQIGVLSVTTLLCALLPAQVVATWSFLLHLWIGGMAAYAWSLDVLRGGGVARLELQSAGADEAPSLASCMAAACGAVSFMLSGLMVEHTMIGHSPIVMVACWTPLVLRSTSRALMGVRPVRSATLAGLLVAVQLLAGGETIFLYNVIAGGILGLAWLVCGGRSSNLAIRDGQPTIELPADSRTGLRADSCGRLLRVLAVGLVVGLVGFGLSAAKVLPGLALMPISNRAGGLSLADSAGQVVEFCEPAVLRSLKFGVGELLDFRTLFPATLILAGIGLLAGTKNPRSRWLALAAFALAAAGVALAHSETMFGLLWRLLPVFRYQRIPQRAMVLAYVGTSTLVSLGAYHSLIFCLRWLTSRESANENKERGLDWGSLPLLLGAGLLLLVSFESWVALPPLPPTADIRQEIRENAIHNHLAGLAFRLGPFRIHAIESSGRDWGIEHVTVPLGLSNLVGWDHLWLLEYLGAEGVIGRDVPPFLGKSYEARHPLRFWGMMNVRYVTSTQPLRVLGLRLQDKFPECRRCQPTKSAGPYLYENDAWMPRAWVVPHAILVLGDRAERLEATYRLLDNDLFDPREIVLIQSDRPLESHSLNELSPYLAIVLPERWANEVKPKSIDECLCEVIAYSPSSKTFWTRPSSVTALLNRLARSEPLQLNPEQLSIPLQEPLEIEDLRANSVRLRVPAQPGWLVLAEKFAHFPGWHASGSRGVHELLKANGVATALRLNEGESERRIDLTYWPVGLTEGLWITCLSLLFTPLLAWLGDRWGRSKRPPPVRPLASGV